VDTFERWPPVVTAKVPRRVTAGLHNLVLLLASLFLTFGLAEGALELALSHPESWSRANGLRRLLRELHMEAEWPIIQFEPACARYDPEVTYTLRPGGCTVRDREFTVRYEVNRLGLRDDERSLVAPGIIVLGDSLAMGWGVAQGESFPELLQARLGVVVLNAAISSFGTARELHLLQRLDRRGLRALVIQYCWNDNEENASYVEHGRLVVASRAEYDNWVRSYAEALRYYPGKYILTLFGRLVPVARGDAAAPDDAIEKATRDFLDILLAHSGMLAGQVVVVIPACQHQTPFVAAAGALLPTDRYRALASTVTFVDPAPHQRPAHYYVLDGHLNAAGHALYGSIIEAELRRRGIRFDDAAGPG
jgi:lysophospholipase L1-like esterase